MVDLHTFWNELDAPAHRGNTADRRRKRPPGRCCTGKSTSNPAKHRAKNLYTVQNPPSAAAFLSGAGHWPESPPAWPYVRVNTLNPALAEGLPFVGDVFSFLNQRDAKTN